MYVCNVYFFQLKVDLLGFGKKANINKESVKKMKLQPAC